MILGGRYFKLSNAVFCYGLTPIKLSVYSYLVSCAGQREKCWPAMKTIAACCGCSKNAARDAVTELVMRGFIRKVETFKDESNGKTRQTNNTYYILELPDLKPNRSQEVYTVTLCPACYPDAVARGFVMGPESPDYLDDAKKGGKDSFDISWVYIPLVGGSMVRPGNALLDDMNAWREKVKIPDVDAWDWPGSSGRFKDYLATEDAVRYMWIFTGFFERLISLMDFENAALAMIDEDQRDAVHAFFEECCGVYEKIIRHYKDDFGCDFIFFHDDWGSQRAPFFSADTCMTMIVPYLKRIVDCIHSLGMLIEMHSCGKNEALTPCYLAAGVDIWSPQEQNDVDKIINEVHGKIVVGVWGNAKVQASDEEKNKREKRLRKNTAANTEPTLYIIVHSLV